MTPLGWLVFILMLGIGVCLQLGAPPWLLYVASGLFVAAVFVYLGAFVFFSLRNPDALRSERFSISKMAIEKSIRGDNISGLIDPSLVSDEVVLPTAISPPPALGSGAQ